MGPIKEWPCFLLLYIVILVAEPTGKKQNFAFRVESHYIQVQLARKRLPGEQIPVSLLALKIFLREEHFYGNAIVLWVSWAREALAQSTRQRTANLAIDLLL